MSYLRNGGLVPITKPGRLRRLKSQAMPAVNSTTMSWQYLLPESNVLFDPLTRQKPRQ